MHSKQCLWASKWVQKVCLFARNLWLIPCKLISIGPGEIILSSIYLWIWFSNVFANTIVEMCEENERKCSCILMDFLSGVWRIVCSFFALWNRKKWSISIFWHLVASIFAYRHIRSMQSLCYASQDMNIKVATRVSILLCAQYKILCTFDNIINDIMWWF